MPKTVSNDITGKRFGHLLAVEFIPDNTQYSKFMCRCDCGREKIVMAQSLIRGATVSCGCYGSKQRSIKQTTHGESGNKTRTGAYSSWANMMMRCEWGGHPSYAVYGAKGIRVCDRWHTFSNFVADMGPRPKGRSIDRIDNTKGYEAANCRWATRVEQSLNTGRTNFVIYEGEKTSVYILCERLRLSRPALRSRAHRRGGDYVAALKSVGVDVHAASS